MHNRRFLTILLVSSFFALFGQNYDLDISIQTYTTPAIDKPSYLIPLVDPRFGTEITRIVGDVGTSIANTSEVWRDVARHGYSTRQPWNADETVLFLGRNRTYGGSWGADLFLDGETYEPIGVANEPKGNEHRWHPKNPNLRLILRDESIISWNYKSDQTNILTTFSGYTETSLGYTGNWDNTGDVVAMSAMRIRDGAQVVFAINTSTGKKYPDIDFTGDTLDFVTISPLANYIVVNGRFGNGPDRTKIFDINGNQVGDTWKEYGRPSHFDIAIDQNGDEVAVGVDKSVDKGKVIKRRLSDGHIEVLTVGGWVRHTSARNIKRPGWVFASVSQSSKYPPYRDEIIAIKLDGSRVERICHSRRVFSDYQNEEHLCPSPSGNRVIYASDWSADGLPFQSYVADFRQKAVATKTLSQNDQLIYPNPSTDRVRVDFDYDQVMIYSVTGRLVSTNLDISHLATGLYIIEFRHDDRKTLFKLYKN